MANAILLIRHEASVNSKRMGIKGREEREGGRKIAEIMCIIFMSLRTYVENEKTECKK